MQHAQKSGEQYSMEAAREELRLDIVDVQTQILKTQSRQATPEDLEEKLKNKYDVELIRENMASNEKVLPKAIGAKVVKKGSPYQFTVDEKLVITNVEVIGVENVIKKQISSLSTGEGNVGLRNVRDLDLGKVYDGVVYNLTWADIAEMAKIIANTVVDNDETNDISSNVSEFDIMYNNIIYKIGVGDKIRLNNKIVHILGFNHDVLSGYSETINADNTITVNSYSDVYGGKHKYAGISFEYEEAIMAEDKMNSSRSNANGWASMSLRTVLNNENIGSVLASLKESIGDKTIKQVQKQYLTTWNNTNSIAISNDYLWFLSCGEVWNSGQNGNESKGGAIATEGEQYKYYKMINPIYNVENSNLKKTITDKAEGSWLRSPYYSLSYPGSCFCVINGQGVLDFYYADHLGLVYPGFAV